MRKFISAGWRRTSIRTGAKSYGGGDQELLKDYACLVPDVLTFAERHRIHKMFWAAIASDGSLDVGGDVISVREMELLSP